VKLSHGDCFDIMRDMPDGCCDAMITDPPFGIGFDYDQHDDSPEQYEAMMLKLVSEARRLVRNDGPVFIWQAMLTADKWHRWFPAGYRIFASCKGFVQYRPTPVQFSWDPVIFFGVPRGESSVYSKDWHINNLAPFGAHRESVDHPCPRPLQAVEYVINIATRPGDVVIDPFMGSGTTGIACVLHGRDFIGMEISEKYFNLARKRIAQAGQSPSFWASRFPSNHGFHLTAAPVGLWDGEPESGAAAGEP